jgi:hypothetical protein
MKNQLSIIIQGTTAGLNNIYISPNLDITNSNIVETLKDERILAAQIANQSTVYSVQTINEYKVYSLIITNITDFTGRSGYYAIKLYSHIDYNVKNVTSLLNQINDKYIAFKESNDLNNQDYNDILNQATLTIQNRIISNKLISTAYVRYYEIENVEHNINNQIIYAVEKLYLFDHEKALNEEQINAQGLVNFENFQKQVKSFQVNNTAGVLKKLIVNGKELNQTSFPETFMSFMKKNDTVSYKTSDDTNTKTALINTNNILEIKRKIIDYKKPGVKVPVKPKGTSPVQKALIIVLIFGFGIGLYLFLTHEEPQVIIPTQTKYEPEVKKDESVFKFTDTTINIEHLVFKNSSIYTSNFNEQLAERYIVKKQESDTCFIVKKQKISNPGPGVLKKSDFSFLEIDSNKTEVFTKELFEKCGCNVVDDTKNKPSAQTVVNTIENQKTLKKVVEKKPSAKEQTNDEFNKIKEGL